MSKLRRLAALLLAALLLARRADVRKKISGAVLSICEIGGGLCVAHGAFLFNDVVGWIVAGILLIAFANLSDFGGD